MRYSNLHTHSIYSDGVNTLEEIVKEAISLDFVSIGFSDHSQTDFYHPSAMRKRGLGAYIRDIDRLKEKYLGQIEIYAGIEYEGRSCYEHPEIFDYLIGDCHFVPDENGAFHEVDHTKESQKKDIDEFFHGEALSYAKSYFEFYYECQKKHRPDVLGHFDLLKIFGQMPQDDKRYQSLALECLHECIKLCPVVELNTGGVARGFCDTPYPSDFVLSEVLRSKGQVVLSSDCHDIQFLKFHFDEESKHLKELGFKSIVQLRGGHFEEVALEE